MITTCADDNSKTVVVLDADGIQISCTDCGHARRLLRSRKAKKVLDTPFTIRMLSFRLRKKKIDA